MAQSNGGETTKPIKDRPAELVDRLNGHQRKDGGQCYDNLCERAHRG